MFIVCIFLLMGCTAPATTASSPNTPGATGPILTDGTEQWTLRSVSFQDSFDDNGETVLPSDQSQTFLQIEFDCTSGASLINLYFGSEIQGSGFSVPGGIPTVYVTDDAGTKYLAVYIEGCSLLVPVAKNRSGFTLHFKDLQPIELGK
jgi:hypothetical protein